MKPDDFPSWLPLWNKNNQGLINQNLTTETWSRLMDPKTPVHGFAAETKGELIGILHYVLHHSTGTIAPVCYMQDVFVHSDHRGKGTARKLVQKLAQEGRKQKWARLYWWTEQNNKAAQALYKTLGTKLDFTLHVLPLEN